MAKRLIFGALVWLAATAAWADDFAQERAQNWDQWRGPEATGTAPLGNPPTQWAEDKNIKWKVEIPGKGNATPVIWGDKIFILTAIKTDRTIEPPPEQKAATDDSAATSRVEHRSVFRQVAFAEEGGATAGGVAAGGAAAGGQPPTNGASGTGGEAKPQAGEQPGGGGAGGGAAGGGRGRGFGRGRGRFGFGPPKPPTNFHKFVVMCLDRNTGKTLWEKVAADVVPHEGHHETGSYASASPVTDGRFVYCFFGSQGLYSYDMEGNPQWKLEIPPMSIKFAFGEGSSPALYGDTLVVVCDQEGEGKSYIMAVNALTGEQKWKVPRDEVTTWDTPVIVEYQGKPQVVTNGKNRARGYDLATGAVLWECGGQMANPIPTSIVANDLAICMTGFRGYVAYAIPLGSTGDITDTDKIAWKLTEGTPYVASPLLYKDRLYFTKDRSAILSCVNAKTGVVIIDQKRLPAVEDLYASPSAAADRIYIVGRNGGGVVLDATKDEVAVLTENKLNDVFNASPAIVGKELYLRGEKSLYCIVEP